MARFIIRLDDICPTMDHGRFAQACEIFKSCDVQPLLGVVPDNKDPDLEVDVPDPSFWETMRTLRDEGWGVAQHGYQHRIHTTDRGLLGITPRSEFAGRPREIQYADLAAGQTILAEQGLGTSIFMAPFHSYDAATLSALKAVGFSTLTDGYGVFPWRNQGILFVPQLFESSFNFGLGVYTMCLHLSNMSEDEIENLRRFLKANSDRVVCFDSACSRTIPSVAAWPISQLLSLALNAKRRVF